ALDERRPTAGAGPRDRFAGDAVDFKHIVAVELKAGNAVHGAALADARIAAGVGEGHLGGEFVVLANEQYRQLPDAGHIQSFVESAVVDRAVAEESDCNTAGSQQLRAVAAAACLQYAWPDDAAGPHHADLRREQVHAAAAAARTAGGPAEQLGHELARRQSLAQCVPVATVRAEDDIILGEMSTHSGRDRLLTDVSMTGAVDEAALMAPRQLLLGLPDDLHRSVERQQNLGIRQLHRDVGH